MKLTPYRVYVDTSVFGGVFDSEFASASAEFFRLGQRGRFEIVVSGVVVAELENAPSSVRSLFDEVSGYARFIDLTKAAEDLAAAYVNSGVVGSSRFYDALHVAMASAEHCSAIVSWNFRHIVHSEKIPLYNAVNRIHGYHEITICAPSEVIKYG